MSAATQNEMERLRKRIAASEAQAARLMAERDEYRNHLAGIAEMTGNKGDIGAAHEGVNAVIEQRDAALEREQTLANWVGRVYEWWGDENKNKLNLKEIEMIINERPVQDIKQDSHCSDERPCIPCFIGKGECKGRGKSFKELLKESIEREQALAASLEYHADLLRELRQAFLADKRGFWQSRKLETKLLAIGHVSNTACLAKRDLIKQAEALPDNLESHRRAWQEALERLVELEFEEANKGYYQHELNAMRDMYADLDRKQHQQAEAQNDYAKVNGAQQ